MERGSSASTPRRDATTAPASPRTAPEEDLESLLAGSAAELVCGGHTHRPADRRIGPTRAVNLGAVSNPIEGDRRASYVIVAADRHGTAVEHRRVAYDVERFVRSVEASSHPAADYIAGFQRGEHQRFP